MINVLDACAMIAYLRDEPGADVVEALVLDKTSSCLAHAVNLCEVFYDFMRAADENAAHTAIADLESMGLVVREDMDSQFWQEAGKYKATIKKVSLADCFAMALTNRIQADLYTSDHHEFDPIAASGVCSVKFIR
ncbi:PIN domain-containing protein [candidate division KSB1 bacterium]|nr:PIN domain-containing protein [candidate division KSB1 bacterium]